MNYLYIPIGTNCHIAENLKTVNLRNQSLPFDWLLIESSKNFEYCNNLINTSFCNFTKDLIYNYRNKVISKHYPYSEFFHYDLINNITLDKESDKNKDLIDMMNRRAERFMKIISDNSKEIIFICGIMFNSFKIFDHTKVHKDMADFENNKNINVKTFKVLVYFINDDDYNLEIPNIYCDLHKFIFLKYIRNTKFSKNYGEPLDFLNLLKNINK